MTTSTFEPASPDKVREYIATLEAQFDFLTEQLKSIQKDVDAMLKLTGSKKKLEKKKVEKKKQLREVLGRVLNTKKDIERIMYT